MKFVIVLQELRHVFLSYLSLEAYEIESFQNGQQPKHEHNHDINTICSINIE